MIPAISQRLRTEKLTRTQSRSWQALLRLDRETGVSGPAGLAYWLPEDSKSSSSSSWMMIRGVTIIIRLSVSRPMPVLLKRRLM